MSDMTQQTPAADKTTVHAGPGSPLEVAEPTSDEVRACTLDAHDWVTKRNDHGDLYETCSHCGKQAYWIPRRVSASS
jgi:hypothetical protein